MKCKQGRYFSLKVRLEDTWLEPWLVSWGTVWWLRAYMQNDVNFEVVWNLSKLMSTVEIIANPLLAFRWQKGSPIYTIITWSYFLIFPQQITVLVSVPNHQVQIPTYGNHTVRYGIFCTIIWEEWCISN